MSSKDVAQSDDEATPAPIDVDSLPTLELDDIVQETEAQLQARGAAYAREYARVEAAPTILARNIATVCVALRVQLGDMAGTSYDYKQRIAEFYRESGVGGDQLERMQKAVRWHVGNVLRRTMTARELEKLGLLLTSPLERSQDTRAKNAALVTALRAAEDVDASTPRKPVKRGKGKAGDVPVQPAPGGRATADHLRLAHGVVAVLGQMDADVIIERMTDGQRAKLDEQLAEAQKTLAALRRHTRKSRSKA